MKKIGLFIFLLSFGFSCLAQHTDKEEKKRIQQVQNLVAAKLSHNIHAVTSTENRNEFWSFAELGDSVRLLVIRYYQDQNMYTEEYLVENGKLIGAFEQELFIPYNHTVQRVWYCTYYLKDEEVFYHISLGQGKTEDNSWNPNDILLQYRKRLAQKDKIKE